MHDPTSPALQSPARHPVPRHILPTIALAQLGGTSLWFAANAIDADLQRDWALAGSTAGAVTSAVHAGFIVGTLFYSLLMIADRFSPRKVYLVSSVLAALSNAAVLLLPAALLSMTGTRFGIGFFLAGIYPVGMKIASGWYQKGLGGALGFLVGALVLGTALPHALRGLGTAWPWQEVILVLSALAIGGGLLMWFLVPDGPYLAKGGRVSARALTLIWHDRKVRASVFGYFGHMWELYGVLMLIPIIFAHYLQTPSSPQVSWLSFAAIGVGAHRLRRGRHARRPLGQRHRRLGAAAGERAVLPARAVDAVRALVAVRRLDDGVGPRGFRRLAAVQRADRAQQPAGSGRWRAHARQLHRLRHQHRVDPGGLAGAAALSARDGAAVAGGRAGDRPGLHVAAGDVGE